jgi:hypothetical protein
VDLRIRRIGFCAAGWDMPVEFSAIVLGMYHVFAIEKFRHFVEMFISEKYRSQRKKAKWTEERMKR